MTWILIIKRDGICGYGGQPWMDSRKRLHIEFFSAKDPLRPPWQYSTRESAEMHLRKWQRDFPADASGWIAEIAQIGG